MSSRHVRTNYFIKKDFQTKLTVIILLIVVIVANLVGGIIYGLLTGSETTRYLSETFKLPTAQLLLPVIIVSEIITVIVVAIIGVFISHSMAGPVYRFEKVLKSMGKGELDCSFKLRSGDEFHELEVKINQLISVLNDKIGNVKHVLKECDENLDSKKDLDELKESLVKINNLLEYFKIDEEELAFNNAGEDIEETEVKVKTNES